ncbi:aldo/keto reductase [Marinobacterium maritimum]|uniref:Aldo/keto reductase n=1 Tax=Marinobacterium maritimum TaxID=500162 RepID=A0ABP3TE07_9GAMM
MSATLSNHFNQPGIGLGCMNLSHAYGTPLSEEDAIRALQQAFDMGYRHFDTATLYGGGRNETVVGKALKEQRQTLFLASKCGMAINPERGVKEIDGRPETLRAQCEASLRRLQTDHIDLYYLHRLDPNTPIEDSVGALAELVREGKIGAIGLSEVSAATLKRAQAVHPIAALQTEYSLWSRNAEIAVLDACRDSGTAFVAFSPLARGFLTNTLLDVTGLVEKDIRNNMPRFHQDNYQQNIKLLDGYITIANEVGCTPAQLALAWVKSKGDFIVPIPGTRSVEHMQENLAAAPLQLTTDTVARLDALINQDSVHGTRYNAAQQAEIDTEEFA